MMIISGLKSMPLLRPIACLAIGCAAFFLAPTTTSVTGDLALCTVVVSFVAWRVASPISHLAQVALVVTAILGPIALAATRVEEFKRLVEIWPAVSFETVSTLSVVTVVLMGGLLTLNNRLSRVAGILIVVSCTWAIALLPLVQTVSALDVTSLSWRHALEPVRSHSFLGAVLILVALPLGALTAAIETAARDKA